jgi:hypothetical protein
VKKAMIVAVALIFGFVSGSYFSRPPKVKASTLFHMQKVRAAQFGDSTTMVSEDYVGFACTAQDCYILSR